MNHVAWKTEGGLASLQGGQPQMLGSPSKEEAAICKGPIGEVLLGIKTGTCETGLWLKMTSQQPRGVGISWISLCLAVLISKEISIRYAEGSLMLTYQGTFRWCCIWLTMNQKQRGGDVFPFCFLSWLLSWIPFVGCFIFRFGEWPSLWSRGPDSSWRMSF